MPKYLTREAARVFLLDQGIPIKGEGLKDHAKRGTGPRYSIVNGRAVYTKENLLSWIDDQAVRSPVRLGKIAINPKVKEAALRCLEAGAMLFVPSDNPSADAAVDQALRFLKLATHPIDAGRIYQVPRHIP